jgi:lipopolysaccharide export LptBFGC system permease protein LptF
MLSIGILSLVYIITFSEMMRKIDTHNGTHFWNILYLSFAQLPPIIDKIFPFLILLSSLWSIFNMLKTSELIILKVSSISLWRVGWTYCLTAFVLSMIYVFLIMPTLVFMHHGYRLWENSQINIVQNINKKIIFKNSEENTKQVVFLTAQEMNVHDNILKNVHVTFMDNQHLIERIYFAPQASYDAVNKMLVFDTLTAFKTNTVTIEQEKIMSNFILKVNLDNIYSLNNSKQSLTSVYEYPKLIDTQKEQKLSVNHLSVLFYSLLFLPLTCGIYSFISVASVPNLYRGLKNTHNIVIALSGGLLFYTLDNWIMVIAGNGMLPLIITVLTVKVPVILLCIITIFNKEYGFGQKKSFK